MTKSISAMEITLDMSGIVVSGCGLSITRLRTSFGTIPLTSCGNLRTAAGGFALTITSC
jgi:hypothetical protein